MAIKPFLEDPGVKEISDGNKEPGVNGGITYVHPSANPLKLTPVVSGAVTGSGNDSGDPMIISAGGTVTITIDNAPNFTSIEWFNNGDSLTIGLSGNPSGAVLTINKATPGFTAGWYSLTVVGINLASSSPVETNEIPLWILIE